MKQTYLITHVIIALTLAMALATFGCRATPTPAPGMPAASPRDIREQARHEAVAAATRGLTFEGERVQVEAGARGTRAQALEHLGRGRALLERRREMAALEACTAAVRIDPELVDAYVALARALRRVERSELALAALRTAIHRDVHHGDAHYELGMMLGAQGDFSQAITVMAKALELDPDRGRGHERLAVWHYYTGADDLAWKHVHLARAAGFPPPPQLVKLLEARAR